MSEFTWDNERLKNVKNEILRDVLLKENESSYSEYDDNFKGHLSIDKFKSSYKDMKDYLYYNSKYLYEISILLQKHLNLGGLVRYEFNPEAFSLETILEITNEFIKYINDDDLMKHFNYLINPDNHVLRIINYDKNIPIANEVRGRVLSFDGDTYLSYYLKGAVDDIIYFMHEIGHYFAKKCEKNVYISNFASEFEGILPELLISSYIGKKIDDDMVRNCLISNRISNTVSDIIITEYQQIIYTSLFNKYNIDKITKKINKRHDMKIYENPSEEFLFKDNLIELRGRIHSSLLAFYIVAKNNWDIKSSFEQYKDILLSDIKIFDELIDEYNIAIEDYLKSFDDLYSKAKEFEKKMKK